MDVHVDSRQYHQYIYIVIMETDGMARDGTTKRVTIDLDLARHHSLRVAAAKDSTDGMGIMRAALDMYLQARHPELVVADGTKGE